MLTVRWPKEMELGTRLTRRSIVALPVTLAAGTAMAACGSQQGATGAGSVAPPTVAPSLSAVPAAPTMARDVSLTLYNAQHEDLVRAMTEGFTKQTGIVVELRNGKDFEFANQ